MACIYIYIYVYIYIYTHVHVHVYLWVVSVFIEQTPKILPMMMDQQEVEYDRCIRGR